MSNEEGSHARWLIGQAVEQLDRVRRGPQQHLEHLRDARHAQNDIHDAIRQLVTAARREGHSWAAIGRALGVSRQAVRQANLKHQAHEDKRRELAWMIDWTVPLPPGAQPSKPLAKAWPWRLRWTRTRRRDAA